MFALSKLIPVPMRSRYGAPGDGYSATHKATWIQWRGRIFRHRVTAL